MKEATISADIINSTSFDKDDTVMLSQYLTDFFVLLNSRFCDSWGRVVRGDGMEIVVPNVKDLVRIAVVLKCYIKAFKVNFSSFTNASRGHRRIPNFGIRVVIGIGGLRINDQKLGLIDGEAIYNSGRMLSIISSRRRGTLRRRGALVVVGEEGVGLVWLQPMLSLIDEIISHATAKQCDIMVRRFLGQTENQIAQTIGISQAAVNTHLRRAGWHAISEAIDFYEDYFTKRKDLLWN
jgi:hypothetical protein